MRFLRSTLVFLPFAAPILLAAEELPRGASQYTTACIACHQLDGKGIAGIYPPLAKSEWVKGSERRLAAILLYGLTGPITVNDTTYPGIPMPAFRKGSSFDWSDAQIADVLTYVRSSWDNDAPAVEPAVVTELRERLGERAEMTEAELRELK